MASWTGARDLALAWAKPPAWEDILSSELHFGNEENHFFTEALAQTATYIEYGAGSSTLVAAKTVETLVSIESDKRFAKAVGRRMQPGVRQSLEATQIVQHVSLGPVGPLGIPVAKGTVASAVFRWHRYPTAPFGTEFFPTTQSTLVLVDGRLRVACGLAAFWNLSGTDSRVIVDDYQGRDWYHQLETFGRLDCRVGRMAVFRPPETKPKEAVFLSAFDSACRDWR